MRGSNSLSSTSGKSWLVPALVVGVPILIAAIIFSRWNDSVLQELEAYKQDARAQGFPVTLEELDAWYPAVPDAENAALVYEEAFLLMEEIDPDFKQLDELWTLREDELPESGNPAHLMAHIAEYLPSQTEVLEKLEDASQLKESRFPVDYSQGLNMNLGHLRSLRSSARLLVLSADQALEQGDTERATESFVQVLAISRAGMMEPSAIAQDMRLAVGSMAFNEIERALSRGNFSSSQLAALDTAWSEAHDPRAFTRAMAAERCLATAEIDAVFDIYLAAVLSFKYYPRSSKIKAALARRLPNVVRRPYLNHEQLNLYRVYAPAITSGDPDWPALFKDPPLQDLPEDTWAPFSASLLRVQQRDFRKFMWDETAYRVSRAALAIERYRLDHGAMPEALEACVPEYVPAEVILDPYNGEPLKYRPEEDGGFKVYSVFENLVDDGGERWEQQGPDSFSGDWVFTVTRGGKTIWKPRMNTNKRQ